MSFATARTSDTDAPGSNVCFDQLSVLRFRARKVWGACPGASHFLSTISAHFGFPSKTFDGNQNYPPFTAARRTADVRRILWHPHVLRRLIAQDRRALAMRFAEPKRKKGPTRRFFV